MHKVIKGKFRQARIDKNTFLKSILGNLVADLDTEAKNLKVDLLDDIKVIEIINKWVKRMSSLTETYKNNPQALQDTIDELEVYKDLLPEQLSEFEIIETIKSGAVNSIPEVMKLFSSVYFGRYNSKEVIRIFKSMEG